MPIRPRVRRLSRDLNLAVHLAIHTAGCITAGAVHVWRDRHHPHRGGNLRRELARMVRHYLASAVDGRDFFPVDGDREGRRPSQLPRQARRDRRESADRRRRQVMMLLDALGTSPDAVRDSLGRHWQIVGDERPYGLVEDYLATRLVHRDRHAVVCIDVYTWVCNVGGTWITAPRPVRRYLRHAPAHERLLGSVCSQSSRRGVNASPDADPGQLLVAATNR
jgi:hypothetical protein